MSEAFGKYLSGVKSVTIVDGTTLKIWVAIDITKTIRHGILTIKDD